jgi:hypothetical protein
VILSGLGTARLQQGKFAEGEEAYRECLAIRERKLPDAWFTFYTRTLLGGSLLGQKKYDDAAPILLSGYEGMKQREATIPASKSILKEALKRLVQLYEETHRPDEAAQWKQKLEELGVPEK